MFQGSHFNLKKMSQTKNRVDAKQNDFHYAFPPLISLRVPRRGRGVFRVQSCGFSSTRLLVRVSSTSVPYAILCRTGLV